MGARLLASNHELQAIAERITRVEPLEPLRVVPLRPVDGETGLVEPFCSALELGDSLDLECRVCSLRRSRVGLDTEVDLRLAVAEPDAAAARELGRLLDLGHAEGIAIEPPALVLAALRDA